MPLIYLILGAVEVLLAIAYGFALSDFVPLGVFRIAALCIPIVVLAILYRPKTERSYLRRLAAAVIPSLFLAALAVIVYVEGNMLSGELVGEYDVVVTDVSYRGDGTAYFTSSDGERASVELNDDRVVITDGDDVVEVGDTVRVCEYVGFFGRPYYVLSDGVE